MRDRGVDKIKLSAMPRNKLENCGTVVVFLCHPALRCGVPSVTVAFNIESLDSGGDRGSRDGRERKARSVGINQADSDASRNKIK